jgi:uncharacterized membrane protein
MVGPVPIALVGAIFYILLLVFLFVFLQTKIKPLMTLIFFLCLACVIVAGILVYLQAFVLHAFCQYCLASEAIDALLFITVWLLWKQQKNPQEI